jgi:hypothetical protein
MLEENWDEFPRILRDMLAAGLVVRRDDGTYALTILGLLEVENDRAKNEHRGMDFDVGPRNRLAAA